MLRVSVGIVTYNSEEYICRCIQSVLDQTWDNIELKLLDNGSLDNTVDLVRSTFPQVKLVSNSTNTGFSGGQNKLIQETTGVYYMPLNPDVLLEPHFIEEMVKAIEQDENIGWVSGKLLFLTEDGRLTTRIYTTGHIIFRDGVVTNAGYNQEDTGQFDDPREVFGANGAAPLYRRAMLEDMAVSPGEYFDQMFFMYGTDPELDWRCRIGGWRCWYTPKAVGYHVSCASSYLKNKTARVDYIRRRYLMVLKCGFAYQVYCYFIPMIFKDFINALRQRDRSTVNAIFTIARYLPQIYCKRRKLMSKVRVNKENFHQHFPKRK